MGNGRLRPSSLRAALFAFVAATVGIGVLLRWQFAGVGWELTKALDLRRAHSHLAFYGILFPLVWFMGVGARSFGLRSKTLWFYFGAVVLSTIGFLTQSYGPVSIVGSTAVLLVWWVFAFDLFRRREHAWSAPIPSFIILSSVLILAVAISTKRDPLLASRLARSFLTLLLFGVLVPSVLKAIEPLQSRMGQRGSWAWTSATLASAVFLTGLSDHFVFGLGPVVLGGMIGFFAFVLFKSRVDFASRRLAAYWLSLGAFLGATGLKILVPTHAVAVAGVHFLVLGPVFLTVSLAKFPGRFERVKWIYEAAVVVMCASIAGPTLFETDIALDGLAAVSGSIAFGCLLFCGALSVSTKLSSSP